MSETKQKPEDEPTKPPEVVEQAAGSLAVEETLELRREAILEKLLRDNADAGL